MKKELIFLTISTALMIGGAAIWIQTTSNFDNSQADVEKHEYNQNHEDRGLDHNHAHHHENENQHEHEDEGQVAINDTQIKKESIEVQQAGPGQIELNIVTRGKIIIRPDNLAHVLPKISGVIRNAYKNQGDSVQAGEILAVLESREIADMRADYLAAQEKEQLADSLHKREKRLHEQKITAEQDFLNAKSAFNEAKINSYLAKQKLHALGLDSEDYDVKSEIRLFHILSPLNGTILNRHLTQGEYVEETALIFEIADLSRVWIEIGIYPQDLQFVKTGQVVEVINPIEHIKGTAKLIYISPILNEDTMIAKAIAELDNPLGQWRPGTFVKVQVALDSLDVAVAIPKTAIQNIEGKDYVFIKNADGFEKREVELGRNDLSHIEIVSGLQPGESFASTKTFILKADLGKNSVEHEH